MRHSSAIVQCFINSDWKDLGLARVAVSRKDGKRFSAAIFLVDLFCLGVKDIIGRFRSEKEFGFFLKMTYFDGRPEHISFDTARTIILGAVDYAASLGFFPHADFEEEKGLLGMESPVRAGSVTFGGPNGKPLYVVGPNDSVGRVVKALETRVGKDGFEVIYPEHVDG